MRIESSLFGLGESHSEDEMHNLAHLVIGTSALSDNIMLLEQIRRLLSFISLILHTLPVVDCIRSNCRGWQGSVIISDPS